MGDLPDFGRSGIPNLTKGLCPPNHCLPLRAFRPSYGPGSQRVPSR